MPWLDGETAPATGVRFLAAWRAIEMSAPGSIVATPSPGAIIPVRTVPSDIRILQRVWWDGQHVYGQPHFWMPLPTEETA